MPSRPAPWVALALFLALASAARAEPAPREVAAVTLPSRDAQAAGLATRMRSLGAQLARARRATLVEGPTTATSTSDVTSTLARAEELAATGNLDEAARLLDPALDAGTRAPHRFADSDALVAAALTRVSIALARGESDVAARWLARLLRWAPTLVLMPAEDAPRLHDAFTAARKRLGREPALEREDLGGLCAVDELVVARALGPRRIEVQRLRRCHVVATAVVAEVDDAVLPLLGVALPSASAPVTPVPAAPADDPPFYRRGWFWVGVGVAASIVAITVWQVEEPDQQIDVVPRY